MTAFLFMFVSTAWACFAPPESWSWPDDKLVACTSDIVVAKYENDQFTVQETLKGDKRIGDSFTVNSTPQSSGGKNVGIGPDCKLTTSFSSGHVYLVFHHAHNPKGYEEVTVPKSAWYQKVKKLIKKSGSKPKDCGALSPEITP